MTSEPRVARIRRPKVEEAEADDVVVDAPEQEAEKGSRVTPRDLRRARRKAKRLGLNAADDHEALRLLKEKGIDVQSDDSILEFVQPPNENDAVQLPVEAMEVGVPSADVAPALPVSDAERMQEISRIQLDLVKRRRRRLALLAFKLLFFVALPTFIVGYYYHNIATPMYETKSAFVVQKNEGQASPVGGLLSGTGFASSQDSITVQDFLTSREAMIRLDEEHGFIGHFQQNWIDDIQRLPVEASREDAYKLYNKRVKVGFDPTEGIIRMEVVAATADASATFNGALISYAEERVAALSQRVRTDQMAGARAAFEQAELEMKEAQTRVVELQQERGVLSAEVEISAQMSLINALELEREQKRLDLAQIEANARPNDTRVTVLKAELDRIDARILELRSAMTQSSDNQASLARITGELAVAEADLANRQLMLQTALQQSISAQVEADRQARYLETGVRPVAPDVATYPKAMENTVLAFVIFGAIYILLSLTVSILREQVSV